MTHDEVNAWLARYVEAWKSYEREQIEALFSEDARCRYHPYDDPIVGRKAIVESWLGVGDHAGAPERDALGTYDATYSAYAVEGDAAVAIGSSRYTEEPGGPVTEVYDNCFVMRFDAEGRCRDFTEWFMKRSAP